MAAAVDIELKKAFQELQGKVISTTQQLKVCDMQIESFSRQIQHSTIVAAELSSQPDKTRTYQGVGRMFILKPREDILNGITDKKRAMEDKVKSIDNQKTYLQNSIKEAENSLRELVTAKQKS